MTMRGNVSTVTANKHNVAIHVRSCPLSVIC